MNRKPLKLSMQYFAEGDPAPAPTPGPTPTPQPGITPPQAGTVDMEAINKAAEARAERAAQAVVKDMLTKQGLDDEAIQGVLADWKSKQKTPAQMLQEANDRNAALAGELTKTKLTAALEKKVDPQLVPLLLNDELVRAADPATMDIEAICTGLAQKYPAPFAPPNPNKLLNIPPAGEFGEVITKEAYQKMNYMQRYEFKQNNPDLYATITKG